MCGIGRMYSRAGQLLTGETARPDDAWMTDRMGLSSAFYFSRLYSSKPYFSNAAFSA